MLTHKIDMWTPPRDSKEKDRFTIIAAGEAMRMFLDGFSLLFTAVHPIVDLVVITHHPHLRPSRSLAHCM
jgi:hypothetical protein